MRITFKPWDSKGRLHLTDGHFFFQPYWGKPAVRYDRGEAGNVGIIEARSAPASYPTNLMIRNVEIHDS